MPKNKKALPQIQNASSEIGAIIRDARIAKQMSQLELSKLLGYSNAQYISDWERARSPVPMNKLVLIASILQVDLDKLFDLFLSFSIQRLTIEMTSEYQSLRRKRSGRSIN